MNTDKQDFKKTYNIRVYPGNPCPIEKPEKA